MNYVYIYLLLGALVYLASSWQFSMMMKQIRKSAMSQQRVYAVVIGTALTVIVTWPFVVYKRFESYRAYARFSTELSGDTDTEVGLLYLIALLREAMREPAKRNKAVEVIAMLENLYTSEERKDVMKQAKTLMEQRQSETADS